ncbi:phosphatase PAP2 family protein [Phenylobacterium sp.]|uniref:acid phosphatase n=1 Tax=Phenylobacterium sp. TaxID=1871053 RepID=UPI00286A8E9E|nr:phosphatase PAP2 family protein [Phenylobacterium sp.]
MLRTLAMAAVALATMGAAAPALAPKPLPPVPQPYLGDAAPDSFKILPPAPVVGTTRYEADRTMFLSTRRLKDTPRWALARNDDNGAGLIKDLSCALGVELTAQSAPKLLSMIPRIARDASRATNLPKDIYRRQRPYLVDEGPICVAKTDFLSKNPDYPSGHVTYSWTVGLILAELAPDRATEILVRARAFGESRLVCGVHSMSAVEAGRTNGAIVVAGLHGSADFRKDLEIARREIAAARKAGPAPDPVACAAEAELLKSPY